MDLVSELTELRLSAHPPKNENWGPEVLDALRVVRRQGPKAARRGALLALLYVGGEAALDEADLKALTRVTRLKIRKEPPYAFDACFNYWLTVRGGDQAGIMATMGLTDALPATYVLGETLVEYLAHSGPGWDEAFEHVFMSPELNGWTVIRGPSCDPDLARTAVWIEQLSAAYGHAQAYFFGSQNDGDAWLVGEAGHLIRRFDSNEADKCFGEPLPIERSWLDNHGLTTAPEFLSRDERWDSRYDDDCSAPAAACAISIDPIWARNWPSDLEVSGIPLIARTKAGTPQSLVRGCWPLEL